MSSISHYTCNQVLRYTLGLPILSVGKVSAAVGCLATGGVLGFLTPLYLFNCKEEKLELYKKKITFFKDLGLKGSNLCNKYGNNIIDSEIVKIKNAQIDNAIGIASTFIAIPFGILASPIVLIISLVACSIFGLASAIAQGIFGCCQSTYCLASGQLDGCKK